jgi:ABC-type Mn2+/Zn2+ transport system ATPase subunit
MQPLVSMAGVALGYGRKRVLEGVGLEIRRGDYAALVGANGSGKTTLLRGILGLLRPLAGSVTRAPGVRFGYVPQGQTVDEAFPLTAHEVVAMGRYARLRPLGRPCVADQEAVRAALSDVGARELENELFRDLSGGQKQRVLIARALAGEPDVLVLDEHTAGLDLGGEHAVAALIDRLQSERRFAVLAVSHSLNLVVNHARTIGLIRDGRFSFAPAHEMLRGDFLTDFYGVPLQVLEVAGRKVVA